jgi:cytochrome c peroxidase
MPRSMTIFAATLLLFACSNERDYAPLPPLPAGLPPVPVPESGHLTPAKVELGRQLFFDERLSLDRTVSCATCHDPKAAWAEHKKVSFGVKNQMGPRNSPTVLNAAYLPVQFWEIACHCVLRHS